MHHRLSTKQPGRQNGLANWHQPASVICHPCVGTMGTWWNSHGVRSRICACTWALSYLGFPICCHCWMPNMPPTESNTKSPTCYHPLKRLSVLLVVSWLKWNPSSLEWPVIHFNKNRHTFWICIAFLTAGTQVAPLFESSWSVQSGCHWHLINPRHALYSKEGVVMDIRQ